MSRFLSPPRDRAGLPPIVFLLRDDFTTDDSAPLTSPRTAEPGPGTLTAVEVDGTLAISGAALDFTAQSSPTNGDLGFYGTGGFALSGGLAFIVSINFSTISHAGFGFVNSADVIYSAAGGNRWALSPGTGTLGILNEEESSLTLTDTISTSTQYEFAVILRSNGVFYLIKGGAFTEWTLLYVTNDAPEATVYPMFGNSASVGSLEYFYLAQLPAPWDTDNGIATMYNASPDSGLAITHEADCILEMVIAGTSRGIGFRHQDADNRWLAWVNGSGTVFLYEYVAASPTSRGSSVLGLSGGERLVVIAVDETIILYVDDVEIISYSSAANYKTATVGTISGAGNTNFASWPRTLSGDALTTLEARIE